MNTSTTPGPGKYSVHDGCSP